MRAYYNEIDPYAAQWLRNLIAAGHLPAGDVDERSIEDVKPDDLREYTQCHFFAGIGGWAYAMDLAGWPRDRPVWTGSCPCQPFSAAGKGTGFDDQRHLWPAWFHLIRECRPPVVLGEQVASKDAEPWVDLVHADLEGMDYAFGCVAFPAASVRAPHIRDRNYWVGHAGRSRSSLGVSTPSRRHEGHTGIADDASGQRTGAGLRSAAGGSVGLANMHGDGLPARDAVRPIRAEHNAQHGGSAFGMANADGGARQQGSAIDERRHTGSDAFTRPGSGSGVVPDGRRASALDGFWDAADWLFCRDGKWRPVEPGTQPLAHGIPGRVGRLRAYGNAIVPQASAEFVASFLDLEQELRRAA